MKMVLTRTQATGKPVLALIIAIFVLGYITVSNAQVPSGKAVTLQEQDTTFHSISDSFSIGIPFRVGSLKMSIIPILMPCWRRCSKDRDC